MIIIDIDQVIEKGIIEDLVRTILAKKNENVLAVQAKFADVNFVTPLHSLYHVFGSFLYNLFNAARSRLGYSVFTGSTACFDVEKLREIGGFETFSIIDDYATTVKILSNNYKIVYLNRTGSTGFMAASITGLIAQMSKYSKGLIYTGVKKFKNILSFKNKAESVDYFLHWAFYVYALIGLVIPVFFLLFLELNIPLLRYPDYPASPLVYLVLGGLMTIPNVVMVLAGLYYEYRYHPVLRDKSIKWWLEFAIFTILYIPVYPYYFMEGIITGFYKGGTGFETTERPTLNTSKTGSNTESRPKKKKKQNKIMRLWLKSIIAIIYGAALLWFSVPHVFSGSFYAIFPLYIGFVMTFHPILWLIYSEHL